MTSRERDFGFTGGLNLAGITLQTKPGECGLLENYECLAQGGYRRYDGFERYDGHLEPSKAAYSVLGYQAGHGFTIDQTIVGGTSGATAHVFFVTSTGGSAAAGTQAGSLFIDRIVGSFLPNEPIKVGAATIAQSVDQQADGSTADDDYDDRAAEVADSARALIGPIPGQGRTLGACVFRGVVYGFRNAVGGATAAMYASSPAGWVLKKSGLAPNGHYEFRIANFYGGANTRYLYGVSGVHKGFEWTGSTWNDISTGIDANGGPPDTPTRLEVHKNYLFYAYPGGSVENSGVGTPLVWTVRTGAQELGVGDEVTAMKSIVGGVLVIYCVGQTWLFTGSSSVDWALTINAPDSGAFPFSVQSPPGSTVAVDQRGIMPLRTTQAYGDFETASVSQRVQKLLDTRSALFVGSTVIKAKSQYRMLYSDGVCVTVTYRGSVIVGYTVLRFPVFPTCAFNGLDIDGVEMVLMGDLDGFVYRCDVGMSFDGLPIDAVIRTTPDVVNSTRQIKQFQNLILQVLTPRPISLLVQALFDFDLAPPALAAYIASLGTYSVGGWDNANWDEMVWDVGDERPGISQPATRIDGVGQNVAFLIYFTGQVRPPHTLESAQIIYKDRGFRK